MLALIGSQNNATTEQFVRQISICMPHVKDIIIKGVDKRTHVLVSMTSDAGKNDIKKLKLQDPPALCVHFFANHFMVVIDENGNADGNGRFRDLTLSQRQEKNVFIVEGTCFLGITCTDEGSTRFLSIPTKDVTIIKKLLKHFKEIYEKEAPIHLKIQVPHIKLTDVIQRMPEPLDFASLSFSGQRVTKNSIKRICDRGTEAPVFLHVNMERKVDRNPGDFWEYAIVYIQNAYWIEFASFTSFHNKIVILENTKICGPYLNTFLMTAITVPIFPMKCWIVTLQEDEPPFDLSIHSRVHRFLPYDGARRPEHFEMPPDLRMYIPEKWRRINLARGKDFVRNDGSIVTRLVSGRTLIFVVW